MSDIKAGDLVMVVRGMPCCGKSKFMGMVFTVQNESARGMGYCTNCGLTFKQDENWRVLAEDIAAHRNRLIKIDPPAEGDSLPTRAEKPINEPA